MSEAKPPRPHSSMSCSRSPAHVPNAPLSACSGGSSRHAIPLRGGPLQGRVDGPRLGESQGTTFVPRDLPNIKGCTQGLAAGSGIQFMVIIFRIRQYRPANCRIP
jgi:hypothetical protein